MSFTLCRLCQNDRGCLNIAEHPEITKKISVCTNIDVNVPAVNPRTICESCSNSIQKFYDFLELVRAVNERLHEEFRYACKDCSEVCTNENSLTRHRRIHEELFCLVCDSTFESSNEKDKHCCIQDDGLQSDDDCSRDSTELIIEDGKVKGSSVCNICNESFPNKEDLVQHKKCHTSFLCSWDKCDKVCRSAYTLKTHEMKHAGKRPYLCVTCGKGFVTKNSLNCHEKIHAEVKGYNCQLCNIGFSVRSNLRAHEKKHHEGVRFYCSQCTRAFITKCSLERHERLHTGVREFQCQSCPSAFYTNKELVKHQRYHQGLKQHKCEQCYKSFFEKHHLTIHMRSHSGERPYACKVPGCNKSFTESQKLTRHHKSRHPTS